MLEHGGRLNAAVQRYGIEPARWLDLSTGINPHGWIVPALPERSWSRLPEADDGLIAAAQAYYNAPPLLPVAGSQAAIQAIPRLRARCSVGVLAPGYAEHAHAWRCAGHGVESVSPDEIDLAVARLDVLVLANPNNPTGTRFTAATLLRWHGALAAKGGWLIVDEAFIDTSPEQSLAPFSERPGLIVLRSLGKFFGLAGARVGFVLAETAFLQRLEDLLGPWAVSGPARVVARLALADRAWQEAMRTRLQHDAGRLNQLLRTCNLAPSGGTDLFQWAVTHQAAAIHERLARHGILTRLFAEPPSLRFGLPGSEADWARLATALPGL